jgi:hypothetical protein
MMYLLVSAVSSLSETEIALVLTAVPCGLLSFPLTFRLPKLIWRRTGGRGSVFLLPDTSSSCEFDLFLDRAKFGIIFG